MATLANYSLRPSGTFRKAAVSSRYEGTMKRFAFCVLLLLTILISAPSISAQECDETGSNPAVEAILNRPDLAEKNPDEFSWKVLIAISAPCYRKCPANGSQNVGSSRIALWDTWADDLYTFPSQPDPWDQDPSKIRHPDFPGN